MPETLGTRIKSERKKNGITQSYIKEHLGIGQSTLSSIENDKYIPSSDTILALSKLFNVSVNWLLTGEKSEHKPVDYNFSKEERRLLELFKQLSPVNRTKILERMETMLDVVREKEVLYKAVPLVGASAAGTPIQALDLNEHQLLQTTKLKADFALTINGQSMEPMIRDNSVIFVHQTPQLENGEIGVFQINNTSFSTDEEVTCKIYKYIAPDHVQLLSVNPEYPVIDINPTKQAFKILGKVIL